MSQPVYPTFTLSQSTPTAPGSGANSTTGVPGLTDLLGNAASVDSYGNIIFAPGSIGALSYKTNQIYLAKSIMAGSITINIPASYLSATNLGVPVAPGLFFDLLARIQGAGGNFYGLRFEVVGNYPTTANLTVYKVVSGTLTNLYTVYPFPSWQHSYTLTFAVGTSSGGSTPITVTLYDATTLRNVASFTFNDTEATLQTAGYFGLSAHNGGGTPLAPYPIVSALQISQGDVAFSLANNSATKSTTVTALAATGIGTAWLTNAPVFTLSGPAAVGSSVNTISATTNTAATFNLVLGSTIGLLTITETNTASASYGWAASFQVENAAATTYTATVVGRSYIETNVPVQVLITPNGTIGTAGNIVATPSGVTTGGAVTTAVSATNSGPFTVSITPTTTGTLTVTLSNTSGLSNPSALTIPVSTPSIAISPTTFTVGVPTVYTITGTNTQFQTGSSTTQPTDLTGGNAGFSDTVINVGAQTITGTYNPGPYTGSHTIGTGLFGVGITNGLPDKATATVTVSAATPANLVVTHGDSLTRGSYASNPNPYLNSVPVIWNSGYTDYPSVVAYALGPMYKVMNMGVSGHKITDMINELTAGYSGNASINSLFDNTKTNNILLFRGGTNDIDLDGASSATVISRTQTYMTDLLAANPGWIVGYCTITPSSYSASPNNFNAIALAVNTYIRTNWKSMGFAFLVDLAADARVGFAGCQFNPTYFNYDFLHHRDPGYAVCGNLAAAQIQKYLNSANLLPFRPHAERGGN